MAKPPQDKNPLREYHRLVRAEQESKFRVLLSLLSANPALKGQPPTGMGLRAWLGRIAAYFEKQWWMSSNSKPDLSCDVCNNVLARNLHGHEGACCKKCRQVWCVNCQPLPGVSSWEQKMGDMACPTCGRPLWPV